jgi:Flp pilus assembly protein TadB
MSIDDSSGAPRSWSRLAVTMTGVATSVVLAVTLLLTLGLAAIFWVPLLFLMGIAMLTIWRARRNRQRSEHRDERDLKDPLQAPRPWPTEGVVDDRLPEP